MEANCNKQFPFHIKQFFHRVRIITNIQEVFTGWKYAFLEGKKSYLLTSAKWGTRSQWWSTQQESKMLDMRSKWFYMRRCHLTNIRYLVKQWPAIGAPRDGFRIFKCTNFGYLIYQTLATKDLKSTRLFQDSSSQKWHIFRSWMLEWWSQLPGLIKTRGLNLLVDVEAWFNIYFHSNY